MSQNPDTKHRSSDRGFTLVEVLVTLVIAMIGLLGTIAVQQTVLSATVNANETAVAMRLAAQRIEEINVAAKGAPPGVDLLAAQVNAGNWTPASGYTQMDEKGATGGSANVARWGRRERIVDNTAAGTYEISVEVTYNRDGATLRTYRLDFQRYK